MTNLDTLTPTPAQVQAAVENLAEFHNTIWVDHSRILRCSTDSERWPCPTAVLLAAYRAATRREAGLRGVVKLYLDSHSARARAAHCGCDLCHRARAALAATPSGEEG